MKKKTVIILTCVAVLLIAAAVALAVLLKKEYVEKIKYDHIADVSYNGVNIVGEDGLFYLEKDGEKLSEGYIFLKSVNDYYEDIEAAAVKSGSDLVLFDYYIAHKPDSASYYLITSTGEEYTIVGDNYSIDEVKLPYITFVNNTTSRKAAISLLKIDSSLSGKSGNDLILKPFWEIIPQKYEDKILYTHLLAIDETSENSKSLFCDDGTFIVSSEYLETVTFTDGKKQKKTYFIDADENAVYSLRGELIAKGKEAVKKVSDTFGTLLRYDEKLNANVLDVFSVNGIFTLSDAEYDLLAAKTYFGAIVLPVRSGGTAVLRALDGNVLKFKEIAEQEGGIIRGTLENGEYVYMNESADTLIQTPYSDLALQTELSSENIYVFNSESYKAETNNVNSYYFTKAGANASVMNFDSGVAVSRHFANGQDAAVEGSFVLSETKDGKTSLRICTPFAANPLSDPFDTVETYFQAGIYWSRCVSFERGGYDIIDPISNQKAGSIVCSESDFAKLSINYEGYSLMVSDVYDDKSGIPVLLISVRRYDDNDGATSSVRYYALYRSAYYSSDNFNSRTLRIAEVGMNLLQSDPFTFFEKDNCLVLNGAGSSRVFRLNDSGVLAEAASIPYRVKDIMYDSTDNTLFYYLVESEGGNKGLYDKDGNMILAPYYDEIYSLENGRFVVALRGGVGVLEYRNSKVKQIIDYSYSQITALFDGGYIAADGNGNRVLYEKDKIVKEDPIQSFELITDYSTADDGTLEIRYSTLLSINGDLYIHKSEAVYKPRCESFEAPALTYEDIENERAMLVQYYVDGKIESTEVIYPTEYYRTTFALKQSPNDAGWFFGEDAADQVSPVTKDDILTRPEYIISLYTKTVEK